MSKPVRHTPASMLNTSSYNASEERESNVIGMRIAELRNARDLSLGNLSELLMSYGVEIRPSALSKWEQGGSVPNAYQLITLCKIFGVESPEFFTAGGGVLNSAGLKRLADYKEDLIASGKYAARPLPGRTEILYIDMPVSRLPASAGRGTYLDEGDFETVSFPEKSVPEGAEFGVRVTGDSMTPVYQDGQIVWVKRCRELRRGEVGLFVCDGEGFLKVYDERMPEDPELYTDSTGVCRRQPVLLSYNPAYPPRPVSPGAEFQIIGRVLS